MEIDSQAFIEQLRLQRNSAMDEIAALRILVDALKAKIPPELEVVKSVEK